MNKIRTLIFSTGATAVWIMSAYAFTFSDIPIGRVIGMAVIALFLTIVAMGQGGDKE